MIRRIQSFDSKYDAGRINRPDNQNFLNFTPQENAGKARFLNPPNGGGAGCAACHRPPEFDIDPNSRNNGVITGFGGTDLTNTRSPSLRDLAGPTGQPNGAFIHDASKADLLAVINHYNVIPGDNANLDPRLRRQGGAVQNLNLTPGQKDEIVAFLRTLTGCAVYSDPKWSDPFDAQGNLSLIIIANFLTRLQPVTSGIATLASVGAPGLPYRLESSSNLTDWTFVTTVTAATNGDLLHPVTTSGNSTFYRYAYLVQ